MAFHTVEDGPWPQGTTVAVWATDTLVGGVPVGPPIDTDVATADGTVTFGELTEGGTYTAFGHGGQQAFEAINQETRIARLESGRYWQEGGDPLPSLDVNLTTPENAIALFSRMSDEDGGAGIDYGWVGVAYARELGNRPVTAWAARTEAQKSYGLSSVSRGYGKDQEAHGLEITYGLFPSLATATANGTNVLSNIVLTDPSSQFAAGMQIKGDGAFPVGATISSITGRRGAPSSITVSAAVPAGTYAIRAKDTTGLRESMGGLMTANGGDTDWPGNPNGIGLHFQSYNDYSRARNALQFGQSAVDSIAGRVLRFASTEFERGISVESVVGVNFLVFSSGVFSGGVISFSGVQAASALNFSSSGVYSSGAAIQMGGQNIGLDTTIGTKIGTNATQLLALHGKTPIALQTVTGSRGGNAALADLLTKLHDKGVIINGSSA